MDNQFVLIFQLKPCATSGFKLLLGYLIGFAVVLSTPLKSSRQSSANSFEMRILKIYASLQTANSLPLGSVK